MNTRQDEDARFALLHSSYRRLECVVACLALALVVVVCAGATEALEHPGDHTFAGLLKCLRLQAVNEATFESGVTFKKSVSIEGELKSPEVSALRKELDQIKVDLGAAQEQLKSLSDQHLSHAKAWIAYGSDFTSDKLPPNLNIARVENFPGGVRFHFKKSPGPNYVPIAIAGANENFEPLRIGEYHPNYFEVFHVKSARHGIFVAVFGPNSIDQK